MQLPMQVGPVTLEGAHVRLETMRAEHADELIAATTGLGLFRYFPTSLETPKSMRAFVDYSLVELAQGSRLPFTTFERSSERVADGQGAARPEARPRLAHRARGLPCSATA
jgi:hypothetical protein